MKTIVLSEQGAAVFDRTKIKFNETVCHNQAYLHPQFGGTVQRDFYDRHAAINDVSLQLTSHATKAVIVVGERRSGKTSFVKHIDTFFGEPAQRLDFVTIPWGGIQSWKELAREVLQAVHIDIDRSPGMQLVGAEDPMTGLETPQEFIQVLNKLLINALNRRFVVAIDEFDSILHDAHDARQVVELASALVNTTSLDIQLLLTMARIPELLTDTPLAPPSSSVITLHPFPRADMEQMILEIVGDQHTISADDLAALCALSGGWPYYAKLLLDGMADLPPGPDQVEQALQAAICNESAAHRIANIYEVHFDDSEKKLVLLLAEGRGCITAAEMNRLGRFVQSAAQRLAARNYVEIDPDGECRFRIGLLGPWFREWSRYDLEVDRYVGDLPHRVE